MLDSLCGWVGLVGLGGLGLIIVSNLNRVWLSCRWVGVGLGCDNFEKIFYKALLTCCTRNNLAPLAHQSLLTAGAMQNYKIYECAAI